MKAQRGSRYSSTGQCSIHSADQVYTNGSNEYAASIFRAEVFGVKIEFDFCCPHISAQTCWWLWPHFLCPLPPYNMTDYSPCGVSVYTDHAITTFILYLKMEAKYSFEIFACCYKTTRCHKSQYRNLNRTAKRIRNIALCSSEASSYSNIQGIPVNRKNRCLFPFPQQTATCPHHEPN